MKSTSNWLNTKKIERSMVWIKSEQTQGRRQVEFKWTTSPPPGAYRIKLWTDYEAHSIEMPKDSKTRAHTLEIDALVPVKALIFKADNNGKMQERSKVMRPDDDDCKLKNIGGTFFDFKMNDSLSTLFEYDAIEGVLFIHPSLDPNGDQAVMDAILACWVVPAIIKQLGPHHNSGSLDARVKSGHGKHWEEFFEQLGTKSPNNDEDFVQDCLQKYHEQFHIHDMVKTLLPIT